MFGCFEVSLILDHFYHFGSYGYSDYFEEGDMVVMLCYLTVGTRYKHNMSKTDTKADGTGTKLYLMWYIISRISNDYLEQKQAKTF